MATTRITQRRTPFNVYGPLALLNDDCYQSETLTGTRTLVAADAQFLRLDPGGASRTVTLPTEEDHRGFFYIIRNTADAAEDLTVKNDASSTIGTLNQGEWAAFACNGSAWVVLAGSGVGNMTINDSGVLSFGDGADVTFTHDGTTGLDVAFTDNDSGALRFLQGANSYLTFDSTNGVEQLEVGENFQLATDARDISHHLSYVRHDDFDGIAAAATATVTFSATDPTDEDTLTIGDFVYTIQGGAIAADVKDVLLSATEATQATNFVAAINHTGTAGTTYSTGLGAHPDVTASASTAVMTVTARVPGTAGNAINISESSTGIDALAAPTLTGGADGTGGGWVMLSGTDAQALSPAQDTSQAGGVIQLVTGNASGATAADASQMIWRGAPIQLDSVTGPITVEARIRIKSAITTVSVFFGLTDSLALEEAFSNTTDTIASTATDGCGFVFDSAATTQEWFGVAVDSNTDDTGNATTGVAPVADTWQILRFDVDATGANINFFVDNAATADLALSGAAGCGPDVVLYPTVIANATTTASRTVDVDWVRVHIVR